MSKTNVPAVLTQPPATNTSLISSSSAGSLSAPKQTIVTQTDNGYRLPSSETLAFVIKLSISEDKPIMMDYWTSSIDKTVLIGHKADIADKKNTEKMLVRSEEEYTSPISKIYKQGEDMIIITENSIYIVDSKIPSRRISA